MDSIEQIRLLLQRFQDGYFHRDLEKVDEFMELFAEKVEVIGTNGVKPNIDEWYMSRAAARKLVYGDWAAWGDLTLDVQSASIQSLGDVGWIGACATVIKTIGQENYASYLEYIKEFLSNSMLPAEQKLHYILRGGSNTLYELQRGERFIWPLRFTAVVVRELDGWKFAQVNFSFPTVYFPDVRFMENPKEQ